MGRAFRVQSDADESMDVKKAGFLIKESKIVKMWRRRWFVLTSDRLCAFKSEDGLHQSPTEQVDLCECSSVSIVAGRHRMLRVETPLRTLLLEAICDEELDSWLVAIQDCCLTLLLKMAQLDGTSRLRSKCGRLSKFSIPEEKDEDSDAEEFGQNERCESQVNLDIKVDSAIQFKESELPCNLPESGMSFCLTLIAASLF
jgi:hypothetical protein